MSVIPGIHKILHGGDWNPDQWRRYPEVIEADFDLMDKAHCDLFSLGIFSWGMLEPEEGRYDFSFLDMIMDKCADRGKKIFLATPGAAIPAWMGCDHPETLAMNIDGIRSKWNKRQGVCYRSNLFRTRLAAIDEALAQRFAHHPALVAWHINNELSTQCFCPLCLAAFAEFLQQKYGTLENLNRCYWSEFWSHEITAFEQVNPADSASDIARLDWQRFCTASHVELYCMERDAIRKYSDKPAATNMMGLYNGLNYYELGKVCDFIADDCYPNWYSGHIADEAARFGLIHDMHYSMQNKPFVMLESCPGVANYKPFVKMRRPNEFEREMLLALGHGADGTMYFQWRKGRGNCEKIHGAVVGHDGSDKSRIFQQVKEYGRKLENIAETVDSRRNQQVALIYDFESRWALDFTSGFNGEAGKKYVETVTGHYRALWQSNFDVAVIDSTADFSPYKVLIAPQLFMLRAGVAARLKEFVANGGTLVMSALSAYVDENNACFFGGNPGGAELRELFGIWNEDVDGFEPGISRSIEFQGKSYAAVDFAEYLHLEGAEALAVYREDFFAGVPAVTVNSFGRGKAYYIGLRTNWEFLREFYLPILAEQGIAAVAPGVPPELVVSRRIAADGTNYYFVLNLTDKLVAWHLPFAAEDIWNGSGESPVAIIPPDGGTVLRSKQ